MPGRVMHVVAHQDDDLLFMNPDLAAAIRAALPVVTVYVSAGQISGNGDTPEERARSRQLGIQVAYAAMAGKPAGATWDGAVLSVAGRQVEHYTLRGHPNVQLMFMNLPDGGLGALFAGQTAQTIVVRDGVVTRPFSYTHASVVAVLTGLMNHFAPTLLRVQDPLPDPHSSMGEHADHIAAARFAEEAADAYAGQLVTVQYRCYNIADEPVNLDLATRTEKRRIFALYQEFDAVASPNGWTERMYYRWPRGTDWAGSNADGRVQIFVVRRGVVQTYWQTMAGGWGGPRAIGGAGGPLAPAIAAGNNADGRLEIFGRRLSDHRIVTAYQVAPNGGWAAGWADLGSPNAAMSNAERVGVPAVANNGDGRMEIFVRNGGGGVSTAYQTVVNGGWSGWVDLYGSQVGDGLAAVTNPARMIELFAATKDKILHWYQRVPNAGFVMNPAFPAPQAASPPGVALSRNGTIATAYRLGGSGELAISRQVAPAGGWAADPIVLAGRSGVGEPAMVTAPPGTGACVMLFARNIGGTLGHVRQVTPDGAYGSWTDLDGGPFVDYPAAAVDRTGAVLLFAIGMDAVVYTRRQIAAGAANPFGPWQALP